MPPPPNRAGTASKAPKPPPVPGGPPAPLPPPAPRRSDPKASKAPPVREAPDAEHHKTKVGVPPPPDPRVAAARTTLEALQAELGKSDRDSLRQGRLNYEIARLLESPVGDLDGAAKHYQEAYRLCPDHVPTLRGTRRVLLAKKSYPAALSLFDAEARYTGDPAAKAVLFYEKGRVLEDQMAQRREAHEAYAAAVELDPSNLTYLKALERVDLVGEAWDALDRTFERAANAAAADPRLRAALVAERARLAEVKQSDSQAATELFQSALSFDERAPGALFALKRLHTSHKRWRDLADVLRREADQTADPMVRAMACYRMGRVLVDRLGNLDEGLAALERAAESAPSEQLVLEELCRLYEQAKRWEALCRVLERLSERVTTPSERVGILHRIGSICEDKLSDEKSAVAWYRRTLEDDPTYLPALQALGKLYTRKKEWKELIAMHLAEATSLTDGPRRAAAHGRIAILFEEQLGDREQAVAHHARALGLSPGYAPSFKALERLYRQGQRWRELVELYERAVHAATDAETKITFLFKIGRLHEDALDAPGHALTAYRRILEVDDGHLGAIHAMQRAAERAGKWQELVDALELEAAKVKDDKLVVSLLHRAGEVLEDHLDDTDAALSRYQRVVKKDPTFAPALKSLGLSYYRAGRWEDLLEVYRSELSLAPKGPESASLLYKMGEISEEQIGKDDDAIQFYRRAIEMDAFHAPSISALERKLSERGNWTELAKLIELELTSIKDDAVRARTAARLGEVYENRLNQPDKALAAYEQALAADGTFRPALDGRARLLSLEKDYKRLAEELSREAATANDPLLAVAATYRQGEIHRDELSDPKKAIECFEAVLERDPSHVGALLALEPLYVADSAWEQLAQVYATESRVFSDTGARVAALRELARLQEVRGIGAEDQQRATHIAILQMSPSDPSALAALERLALGMGDAQLLTHVDAKLGATSAVPSLAAAHQTRLAETLEALEDPSALDTYRAALGRDPENLAAAYGLVRLAKKSRDPDLLASTAETAAKVLDDREQAARLLVIGAEVKAGLGDAEGALRALERALELNPDHEHAAKELERLLIAMGQIDRLFDILCQAAQWASQSERMAQLWIAVSRLLADQKHDVPAALAALHRVTDELPGHVDTLLALADLYMRDQQWAEAVDRLTRVLAESPSPPIQIRAHLALAEVLHERLGDEDRALSNLEKVLALDDRNKAALERLIKIQVRRGKMDAAASTASRLVTVATDDGERAEALTRLAELEKDRKEYDAAAHAYEQAVAMAGTEGSAAASFKEMLVELKLLGEDPPWSNYVNALSGYLERASVSPDKRAAIYLEVGRVLGDEMGMTERSLAALQRGIAVDPNHVEIRVELATRLKAAGHHPQAAAELKKLLEVDVTRVQTWRDLVASFQGMQRQEEAVLAMAPLVALGAANDLERATVAARPSRFSSTMPGAFDDVAFRGIDARGAPDAAGDLLAAVSEGLAKVHPPELERYGLASRDRITSRSGHPLRMLADRVAQLFGVEEYDLYIHRAHAGSLEVELSDPPAVLVPAHVTGFGETEQVFCLARPLANIARGLHAVNKLSPREVELLLVAAARLADPTFGIGITDEEFLQGHARRVQKALSRRGRRATEESAALFLGSAPVDYTDWCEKIRRTAARAAVTVADDLPACVTLLRRTEGDLAGLKGAALAQGMELVSDLMRFWVSDAAFALRRRLSIL